MDLGSDAITPSRYRVVNRESRFPPRDRALPRHEESYQPIDGELELNERARAATATEALWHVWILGVSISDSRGNDLRTRLDGESVIN